MWTSHASWSCLSRSLFRYDPRPAFWEKCGAYFAYGSIATACGAIFAAVKDNLQMQIVPLFDREKFAEVHFGLQDILAVGQLPTLGQTVDVGIYRKRRLAKRLAHHDTGRFSPDAR